MVRTRMRNFLMTPKFITLTRMGNFPNLDKTIYINPRRVNKFHEARRSTQHPEVFEGTIVDFGRESILVCETPEQIVSLLKRK